MPKPNPTLDAINERLALNDTLLVQDKEESKKLWKEHYGKLTGHSAAWTAKWNKPKASWKDALPRPNLLDAKKNEMAFEPPAYSIGRVEGGWVVMTYEIRSDRCILTHISKPEGKQFAVARMMELVKKDMMI